MPNNSIRNIVFLFFFLLNFNSFAQENKFINKGEAVDTLINGKTVKKEYSQKQDWNLLINEFVALNTTSYSDEFDEFDDWIEIYNFGSTELNLKGLFISDAINNPFKWQIPEDLLIAPNSYIVLWADNEPEQGNKHLGFSLSSESERIAIYTNEGILIDQINFPQQHLNVSYGRVNNSSSTWAFFSEITAEKRNSDSYELKALNQPIFSNTSGFYDNELNISINSPDNAIIYYTLDGSKPTLNSSIFNQAISINKTTILRAICLRKGSLPSKTTTHSYFFNTKNTLPVVSISTNSTNLWGSNGIYTNPYSGVETEVHLEYFEKNKELAFSISGGLKIHGDGNDEQKGFRFYVRSQYDDKKINYRIFREKNLANFDRLIFRCGGNDMLQYGKTHLRDPLIHVLNGMLDEPADYSAYQPVNLYLNGEYWGIYNLREREDLEYIENSFGKQNDLDLLEHAFGYEGLRYAIEGNWDFYRQVNEELKTTDMSLESNYLHYEQFLDINEYITYCNVEVFAGNLDWIGNNTKFWRDKPNSKWRWILWDLDHGFGLPYTFNGVNYGDPNWNTLANMISTDGFRVGTDGFYNVYIRKFMENENFKHKFINRGADLLNTIFKPIFLKNVLDSLKNQIAPSVEAHCNKWGSSYTHWEEEIVKIEDYIEVRNENVFNHFEEIFSINTAGIEIQIIPENAGKIKINNIVVGNAWEGKYFKEIPIEIEAIANPGFEFDSWGENAKQTIKFEINISEGTVITAYFNTVEREFLPVINEINYNSHPSSNSGDWLEIYNPSNTAINLKGWKLKDSNIENVFFFPDITIEANGYFVFCSDVVNYKTNFQSAAHYYGNIGFNFSSNNENIRLYNTENRLIDSVSYGSVFPWFTAPDGLGYSLILKNPLLDNSLVENWAVSFDKGGTPERENFHSVLSIPKQKHSLDIKIYPNPVSDFLQIETTQNRKLSVSIFNIYGKLIMESEISKTTKLDLRELSKGIYILKVTDLLQIYSGKFIKL